jgi:hypothetical protein
MPQMKPNQAAVFRAAAKHFDVYILVRRTNLASLYYIGDPACVPKRLDCKAKTADLDYSHPRFGWKSVAGLVVDPTVAGPGAFKSEQKYRSALREWNCPDGHKGFAETMLVPAGQKSLTYIPNGGFYFVDLDPASARTGCLKFTSSSLLTAGKYIHGDFDLYGIVPADDPSRNVAAAELHHGQKHVRSPEFFDVQMYVNSRIGAPMILHGAQESYGAEHTDEGIDIFYPNGTMLGAETAAEIARLYETLFKGRKQFTKGGVRQIYRGIFETPG